MHKRDKKILRRASRDLSSNLFPINTLSTGGLVRRLSHSLIISECMFFQVASFATVFNIAASSPFSISIRGWDGNSTLSGGTTICADNVKDPSNRIAANMGK